jgi:hypothetical protein
MSVVTIEEISAALRLDLQTDGGSPAEWDDDRIPEVEIKLAQAEDIVREFLKIDASVWPPESLPDRFKAAIMLTFQALFDDKSEWIEALQATPPAGPISGLLRLDRVPTLA